MLVRLTETPSSQALQEAISIDGAIIITLSIREAQLIWICSAVWFYYHAINISILLLYFYDFYKVPLSSLDVEKIEYIIKIKSEAFGD